VSDSLLTEEEVKSYLGIERSEIERLKKRGKLTAYRVGGTFVRFRKDQVIAIRSGRKFMMPDQFERNWFDAVRDFVQFHGIYLLFSVAVILLALYFFQT
jgi:excisionase family DNA binding protein